MKARRLVNLFVLMAVLTSLMGGVSTVRAAGRIYVDIDATGANNGTSWTDAFTDLQSALATAVPDDEMWVAEGVYKPTSGADRSISFQLINGVVLYGGFSGVENSLPERDWNANLTTLSGDIGISGDNSDNSYHVVTGSGTDATAILDGFTITGGNANSNPYYMTGGGFYNKNGSPMLTNLAISGNSANIYGGGMDNDAGNPTLTNVSFHGNTASAGGGLYNYGGSLTLINVIFSNNSVIGSGGGIYSSYGTLTLTHVTFSANSAYLGGGMRSVNSNSTLTDVSFSANTATTDGEGGGMHNSGSGTTSLMNVTFSGNSSSYYGGGLVNTGANLTLTNVTFSVNSAVFRGGGMVNVASSPVLTNVTLYGNSAGDSGSGIYNTSGSNPSLINSIVWNNTPTFNQIAGDPASVTYSDIEGGYTGIGNINADPLLSALGDNGGPTLTHALLSGSPAIDAGSPTVCPATDQRGVPRPQGLLCDIGAYEAILTPIALDDSATMLKDTPVTIDVLANDTAPGDPLSVESVGQPAFGSVSINADDTLTYTPQPSFYGSDTFTYTVSDGSGGTDTALVTLVPAIRNDTWTRAYELEFASPASVEQVIDRSYQSRWYKFNVLPGSEILVTATELPANYNLTLYRDISTAYQELQSPQDLVQLSAEFSPDMFSPDMFSPDMFSPDMFSPDMFSPDMFSPDMFSPDMFSPDMFSPDMFSPDMFSPDMFSPDMFSPDMFSPDMFSPDMFSPDMFSPDMFSPDMFSPDPATFASAQLRSMIAVSAADGTAAEGIRANSWNNSGEFYVRVSGSYGAYDPDAVFHLEVTVLTGVCGSINPALPPSDTTGINEGYRTIVLSDLGRMTGTEAEKSDLGNAIAAFISRSEVTGVWVDVGADARVTAANALADDNPGCPYAENLVADSIKMIVDSYIQAGNPLEYVVIIGNDDVIPFFRYPDNALLANEIDYSPPVLDGTSSQSSLRLGYFLGQDEYGSQIDLVQKSSIIPIPNLAVGRLVETPAEVMHMLSIYSATQAGVLDTPTTGLVTGYDFLADAATEIENELQAGLGEQNPDAVDSLITGGTIAPQLVCQPGSPFDGLCSWTADEAWAALLSQRHDIIFLAGHFSANSWLAADNETRLLAADLANSAVDLENALIFSAGCHSGYNIVDEHGVPGVTREPDWVQAFARKGATFIGGTGYQYGDTDFLEYSERLYLEFSRQLRLGTGPVSLGNALVAAKQSYLYATAEMSGIHEKSLLEATLFGLPMLSIDLPYGRTIPETNPSILPSSSPFPSNPGYDLGLIYSDIVVEPTLTTVSIPLNNPQTYQAIYLSGKDGVMSNPSEPVLPLEMYNVSLDDYVLRGVGFRGGSYADLEDILPLTGAAATDIRGVHTPFITDYFFPVRPWNVNYFGALIDAQDGPTRLVVLPAQYRSSSPTSTTGTLRMYEDMTFRLYYSANIASYTDYGYVPAQAAPPLIASISAAYNESESAIDFQVMVVGDPTAGIQEVWIVYTIEDGLPDGMWQPVDLIQGDVDSRIWTGSLTLENGVSPTDVRYMVQAVNGVGVVSYATNQGAYYTPGSDPGTPPPESQVPTELTIEAPAIGAYGTTVTISATVTSDGEPVSGEIVVFRLGAQTSLAMSDSDGHAVATFKLLGMPGETTVSVNLKGSEDYAASTATDNFTITMQTTQLSITPQNPQLLLGEEATFTANLTDASGNPLQRQNVLFEFRETGSGDLVYIEAIDTDYMGQARLTLPAQLIGEYTFSAQFGSAGMSDPRYLTSSSETSLSVIYDFSGFFPPVDNLPNLNQVNAGRAIPIRFSLNGDQGLEIMEGSPIVIIMACDTSLPVSELTETVPAGESSLSYDAGEDQYIFVWKTNRGWAGTCRQLEIHLVDGTEYILYFKFK